MTADEKIKMTINIGGERFEIQNVPFNSQDDVREAEKWANTLYEEISHKFSSKSPANIMARVTYNMSAQLFRMNKEMEDALALALDCEKQIKGFSHTEE